MLVFSTPTSHKLAASLAAVPGFQSGSCTFKQFRDGEWYVKVDQPVKNQTVVLLGNINAPADNLVQLLLLYNALHHAGASAIDLVIPYFGYQKQDRVLVPGEAASLEVMAQVVGTMQLRKKICIALHSERARELLGESLIELLPAKSLAKASVKLLTPETIVAAPDEGSVDRAQVFAGELGSSRVIFASKERTEDKENVAALSFKSNNIDGASVILIDDFVQSGGTIVEAVADLRRHGAEQIHLLLMHGFLFADGYNRVLEANPDSITVTDTLPLPVENPKFAVVSMAADIAEALVN